MCQGHVQRATPELLNAVALKMDHITTAKGQNVIVIKYEVMYLGKIFCPLCMLTSSILIRLFTRPLLAHVTLYSSTQQLPPPPPLL